MDKRNSSSRTLSVLNLHWGYSFGGISQYVLEIDRVDEYADIEMSTVCIVSRNKHVDEESLNRLKNLTVIWRNGPFDFSWYKTLRNAVIASKPDVLMTHAFNAHAIATLLRFISGIKPRCLVSFHGVYHPPSLIKKAVKVVYDRFTAWYLGRVATGILSVAGFARDNLVSRGIDKNKITVIHNGIDDVAPGTPSKEAAAISIPQDALCLGAVGRLEPVKGLDYLLKAMPELLNNTPELYLVIIGSGVQERELRQLAESLGVSDRVFFAGFVGDVVNCFPMMDIYVLPSLSEVHSISILEAMRAGRAIVATDVGGNRESIDDGKQGIIIPSMNVDALVSSIGRLAKDKELREQLGESARERFVAEFTSTVMRQRTAEAILKFAGQDRS